MIHQELDIDQEWVFLPENRFLGINQDDEKKIHGGGRRNSDAKVVLLKDYFDNNKQVVPVSFPLEPRIYKAPETELEKIKEADSGSVEEVKTQVSFRKPNYNEQSVDMTNKMDSPRSTTRGLIPQIDAAGTFNFEEKNGVLESKKDLVEKKSEDKEGVVAWPEENSGGLNLWKWSLTGVGAICSFGVAAAATLCVIILGSQQRDNRQQEQNQKLLFQRYADDKRMKQVVHHATKFNVAISAARGVPITRAHITFGGYYDGL